VALHLERFLFVKKRKKEEEIWSSAYFERGLIGLEFGSFEWNWAGIWKFWMELELG